MNLLTSFVKRRQLLTFYVLATALFWAAMPLAAIAPGVPIYCGILALAGSAMTVTGITEGKAGIKALLRKVVQWRAGLGWYAFALGVPLLLGLTVVGLSALLGSPISTTYVSQVPVLILASALLAIGEELGWRGFALPRLLNGGSALWASGMVGVLWAVYHVPVFLPGMQFHPLSFPAFLLTVTGYSVLFTWLYQHTRGSVLLAALMHGTINSAGALYFGIEIARWEWLQAAVYGGAALLLVLVAGTRLTRKRAGPPEALRTEPALVR
jgi:membrane protease YdiL (CAAX protease family)